MATYQIPAPSPMSVKGDAAENWRDFENSWQYYVIATKLSKDNEKEIVAATLCTVMGADCKRVMNSLPNLSEADKKDPDKILEELRKHFTPQQNVLYERFIFNTTSQKTGETIDEYVVRLRRLAESCEFGSLKDSLIRDRIVIGTTDESGRERLLRERPVPNLTKVIDSLRAFEISKTHKIAISGKESETVNYTERKRHVGKPKGQGKVSKHADSKKPSNTPKAKQRQPSKDNCRWCGRKADHARKECPAKDATCHQCHKKGHFANVCLSSKSVQELELTDDYTDTYMMGEVSSNGDRFWSCDVEVNKRPCEFKLDSGSKVTVISNQTPLVKGLKLDPVRSEFKGPGNIGLSHLFKGVIRNATLEVGDKSHIEDVYVMINQSNNLLSKSAIQALKLLIPSPEVHHVEKTPDFRQEYPTLFKGLGLMKDTYTIPLKDDAVPVCLYTPRRVAHPLLPKVKEKLEIMVRDNVISPVTEPTDWCSGMVVVPKRNGDVRVCVDLTNLNKAVKREVHPMASVDENLAKIRGSRLFSKLDANSGFWQIPLAEESRLLTSFVTPFGRYCFNRLPFGISSAPEVFQRTMSSVLEGLDGVICHMDDTLIHGTTQEEHDTRVRKALERIQQAGITLNDKCEFSKRRIKFLGHVISENGVEADPDKTKAIRDLPQPTNVKELQRFNGMVNQLAKFIPELATVNEPLRQLLRKDHAFLWDQPQEKAFREIKQKLVSPDVLAHYDASKPSVVAADACQDGLGAVLLQTDSSGKRRPIAFASRSLSDTEKRYAVIEKEALAAVWACEKFSDYILGTEFTLETDHRPLVPLLSSTDLSKMPPRILRFRLRMARYTPEIKYVQGIHQHTADALSRAPTSKPTPDDLKFIEEVEEHTESVVNSLPATQQRLDEIITAQDGDPVLKQVKTYCQEGVMPSQPLLKPYWENKRHLTITRGLLMFNHRLVIPTSLQLEMLEAIHEGHLGITKCQGRAAYSVWWPLLTKNIESMINKCRICSKLRPERKEPLIALSYPSIPWTRLGTDLFELDKKTYIVVVDYTSRWFEVKQLNTVTSSAVIRVLCELFATHGIPDTIISDNGPQYACQEFKEFAKDWGFKHVTSSPVYPQGNGEVERAVQTAKNILKKNENPYLGLLAYRSAPLRNGLTPAELLMSRKLKTRLPATPEVFKPTEVDRKEVARKEQAYTENYTRNYNEHHRVVTLPSLSVGDRVYIRDQQKYGEIQERHNNPRSYKLVTKRVPPSDGTEGL